VAIISDRLRLGQSRGRPHRRALSDRARDQARRKRSARKSVAKSRSQCSTPGSRGASCRSPAFSTSTSETSCASCPNWPNTAPDAHGCFWGLPPADDCREPWSHRTLGRRRDLLAHVSKRAFDVKRVAWIAWQIAEPRVGVSNVLGSAESEVVGTQKNERHCRLRADRPDVDSRQPDAHQERIGCVRAGQKWGSVCPREGRGRSRAQHQSHRGHTVPVHAEAYVWDASLVHRNSSCSVSV
jgi:hypothetical protein